MSFGTFNFLVRNLPTLPEAPKKKPALPPVPPVPASSNARVKSLEKIRNRDEFC
jgi:hypothetical protein